MIYSMLLRLGSYFIMGSYILSLIYIIDPSGKSWGAKNVVVLKYSPVMIALLSLPCFLSVHIRHTYNKIPLSMLLVLSIFIITGSSYTMISHGAVLGDTFMGRGLCILVVLPAYLMFSVTSENKYFTKIAWGPTLVIAMLISGELAMWRLGWGFVDMSQIFHEEIFVPVSAAIIAYVVLSNPLLKLPVITLLLVSGFLSLKNTGMAASLISFSVLAFLAWEQPSVRENKSYITLKRILFVFLSLILMLGVAVAVGYFSDLLPSGSPEVRMHTYTERITLFMENIFIGQSFIGSPIFELPTEFFALFTPSHSDLLDILAFGGLAGFLLFIVPVFMAIKNLKKVKDAFLSGNWAIPFFFSVTIIYLWEMLVNPVWNQPKLAVIFWISIGALLACGNHGLAEPEGSIVAIVEHDGGFVLR